MFSPDKIAIFKLELFIDEEELNELLNIHNEGLALKMKMQEIRSLIFLDAKKGAIEEFIARDKREKDENLIATLESSVGIRPILLSDKYLLLKL